MRSAVLHSLAILLAAAFSTILLGCEEGETQPGFVGNWTSEVDGLGLSIAAGGTFRIQPTDGRAPVNGTWTQVDSQIQFRNIPDSLICADTPGTYTWGFNESGNLVFTLVEDDCPPRIAHMTMPFDPAP